ncbi:DNA-binding FadR family transcriptional regulator [Kushneria sinocarnis]|uniref:DNA-binding FadR family transcriptional regulator n=1 Tax=Kushneria sinocarnis TaxID=595502 RepID=A0A420WTV1_9GAMM|nr:FadR/GntR family transcriptional regulator [Kushneria sinocarnis]RKQ96351.1 DNA-binding FadR family transcriptional regulator [Kushneria sinocarnis]
MISPDSRYTPPRRRQNLSAYVVSALEEMIQQEQLKVGDRLPTESQLGEMFDVSRTVVREAVSHLKSRGMVETRRGIGAFVLRRHASTSFMTEGLSLETASEIVQVLEFRIPIETEAAGLAAARRTPEDIAALEDNLARFARSIGDRHLAKQEDFEFHRLIGAACRNHVYLRFYDFFGETMVPRSHVEDLGARDEVIRYLENVLEEHRAIYRAIVDQAGDRARQAMQDHLGRSWRLYHGRLETSAD